MITWWRCREVLSTSGVWLFEVDLLFASTVMMLIGGAILLMMEVVDHHGER